MGPVQPGAEHDIDEAGQVIAVMVREEHGIEL